MIDYLMWITRPNGTPTLVGDDDGGRLLTVGSRDPYDFRDSIAWGAALLRESRWKHITAEHNPELLWLLGPRGLEQFDRLASPKPAVRQMSFSTSGQFVVRNDWEPDSEYLFFRCGPWGELSGAHDHADQLSFELFANGTAWLVDPGTFTYTASEEARNQFRLSQSHNTLTAGCALLSAPLGPFSWRFRADGRSEPLISSHRFTYLSGFHQASESLPLLPMRHR